LPGNAAGASSRSDDAIEAFRRTSLAGRSSDEPERIGQYRIIKALASGGMGTVYLAEQDHPSRTVALKVMKPGIVTPDTLRRFEYEVKVLGRLQHPNIAQVYEAGTHDDGRGGMPYFVMEFVPDAQTLNEYVGDHPISVNERIAMFIDVCDAVHHGHQKGVIHRDLKPANILIDAQGMPKIIDFGVARATDSDVTGATMQTEVGQLVGTIQYMSPEQVEADPSRIDTRSDVYALGVVLHEFLTGNLPYNLRDLPIYEATRIIREDEVRRIGTAFPTVKGDLETVILHALEKDPERRYQSANALAADLKRYLNDEPISARPPSTLYAMRKFYRRKRGLVLACLAGVIALIFGAIGTLFYAIAADNARDLAEERTSTTESAMEMVFNGLIAQTAARVGNEKDIRLLEALENIAADASTSLEDQPYVLATLYSAVGFSYKEASRFSDAETELRKAIDIYRSIAEQDENIRKRLGKALHELGGVLWFLARYDDARTVLDEALILRMEAFGDVHEEVAHTLDFIAAVEVRRGHFDEAVDLYTQSLDMRRQHWGQENDVVARSMNNKGFALMSRREGDDLVEAEQLFARATELVRQFRGDDHIDVAGGLSNHARVLIELERFDEAESKLIQAIDIQRAKVGSMHDRTAQSLRRLASVYQRGNQWSKALPLQREAWDILNTVFENPLHERIVELAGELFETHRQLGDAEAARRLASDMRQRAINAGDADIAGMWTDRLGRLTNDNA